MKTQFPITIMAIVIALSLSSCGAEKKEQERSVESIVANARKKLTNGHPKKALNILVDSLEDSDLLDSGLNITTLGQAYYQLIDCRKLISSEHKLSPENDSYSAVLSKDNRYLVVTFGQNKMVKVLDYPSFEERMSIQMPDYVYAAELSPDGGLLAVAAHDKNVHLYDFPSGTPQGKLKGHTSAVRDVTFRHDGLLITGSNDHRVKGWDPISKTELWSLHPHSMNVKSVKLSPDGSMFVTAANDGSTQVFNLPDDGRPEYNGRYINASENYVNDAAISTKKSLIVTGGGDKFLKFWSADNHEYFGGIQLDDCVSSTDISPDGRFVAAGTTRSLYIFDSELKEPLLSVHFYGNKNWSVQFIDNNNVLIADCDKIRIVHIPTDKELVAAARKFRAERGNK